MRVVVRFIVSLLIGLAFFMVWQQIPMYGADDRLAAFFRWRLSSNGASAVCLALLHCLPALVVALVACAFLEDYGPARVLQETYCRRCGHILRAISGPKCPSCGETL